MDKVHTTCTYCGCGCGLFLHVEDGRVVGASPSPCHPTSRGRLCIKGWLAGEFVSHPDRLSHPLIRNGGRFVRASWEETLSLTAASLKEISNKFGAEALGVLTSAKGTNEENFMLMKLARLALQTNNVDHVARLCHAPTLAALSYAFGSGAMTCPISSLARADAILVVGSNTTEQHPLVAYRILQARSRGARIIVADPRETRLARLADLHLRPRPGTDVAWLGALLGIIIREGLTDQEFIDARTEGFEAVRQSALGIAPEEAQRITGIDAGDLEKAARVFGEAKAASIVYAMGITQHIAGTDCVQALANLALATGNVGREGTGLCPLRGHQNVQGACDMGALPDYYCGYQRVADAKSKFEKAWNSSLPQEEGLTALEMLQAAEDGRLRGLLIVGENPSLSFPDISRIKKGLQSLEFLAVCDIFPTETTEMANVILPAACFAEKDGTFTSTERRIQRIRRAVAPPGEAREELVIISDLMRRLGVPASHDCSEVMKEIASLAPQYAGVHYDRLGIEGLQWPCPHKDHPGTDFLHRETFSCGRARFRAVQYQEPGEVPDAEYPLCLTTGRSLYQFHTGSMTRRTSLLEREVPAPEVDISPKDADRMKIRSGQMVSIETRRGRIALAARVTESQPPGSIFIPFHFWEAPANALTSQAFDPKSRIPEFKVSAARIRRIQN